MPSPKEQFDAMRKTMPPAEKFSTSVVQGQEILDKRPKKFDQSEWTQEEKEAALAIDTPITNFPVQTQTAVSTTQFSQEVQDMWQDSVLAENSKLQLPSTSAPMPTDWMYTTTIPAKPIQRKDLTHMSKQELRDFIELLQLEISVAADTIAGLEERLLQRRSAVIGIISSLQAVFDISKGNQNVG